MSQAFIGVSLILCAVCGVGLSIAGLLLVSLNRALSKRVWKLQDDVNTLRRDLEPLLNHSKEPSP